MRRTTVMIGTLCVLGVFLTAIPRDVAAQSGSRGNPQRGSSGRGSSGSAARPGQRPEAPVALEGYCPVSLQMMKKWVKGKPAFSTVFDGHTYYFANQRGKQMFLENPVKYAPTLGGDSVVSLEETGKRVPGNIRLAAFHEGRLYLFASEQEKRMFLANAETYEDVDLAYDGNCVVCQLNMQRDMEGQPQFTVVYQGLRYMFPGAKQQQEFLRNPQRYAQVARAARDSSGGAARSGGTPSRTRSGGSGSRLGGSGSRSL